MMETSNVMSSGDTTNRRMTLYELLESGGLDSLDSMEGAWGHWDEAGAGTTEVTGSPWLGVGAAVIVTALAWLIHHLPFAPFTMKGGAMEHPIGISVIAILVGMVVANLCSMSNLKAGCRWITTWCIPAAVVFLGARMDLGMLSGVGSGLFLILLFLIGVVVALSMVVGKIFGMNGHSSFLLGAGTAICGSSAILAVAPVTGAKDEDVVLTVAVVNLVGLLAMCACVVTLWFTPISAELFGAWAGATIHAVPQVVAAGESHGADAAVMATLVKLTRVTMLAPMVLLTVLWVARRASTGDSAERSDCRSLWKFVPWFVWGFIVLAGLKALDVLPVLEFHANSAEPVKVAMSDWLPKVAKWLLALSMAAIGLQVKLKPMLKAGTRAFVAGVVVWLAMSVAAYGCLYCLLG